MPKTIRKRYDFEPFTTAGQARRLEIDLDKGTIALTGILLTADRDDMLYVRGTMQASLSGEELIPEDHHARLLMSGLGVPPAQRFLPMDAAPGNGKLKAVLSDTGGTASTFSPYTVSLYIETKIHDGIGQV